MSDVEGWPDPLADAYELRVTARARADLRASECAGNDLDGINKATPWPDIVEHFRGRRSEDPGGTEAPISKLRRNDVFSVHAAAGRRGATWHDRAHGVVWLLAFTRDHSYKLFERRAANGELLPAAEDYEELRDQRDEQPLERVIEALNALVAQARGARGVRVNGQLAETVNVEALVDGSRRPHRLHLRFRVPPLRASVLGSHFEWTLGGAVDGVDPTSMDNGGFPPPSVPVTVEFWADFL